MTATNIFMICRSLPLIFQCSEKKKPEYVVIASPVHDQEKIRFIKMLGSVNKQVVMPHLTMRIVIFFM